MLEVSEPDLRSPGEDGASLSLLQGKGIVIVFVFGSNEAGIHGAGAAFDAVTHWGAVMGKGYGWQGESYAIPTKDAQLRTLPLYAIEGYVRTFLDQARSNPEDDFQVTRIGCGLAGYSDAHIAPMFKGAPHNAHLPLGWREWPD